MLQIDHVYEFLYHELFIDFEFWHLYNGVPKIGNVTLSDISIFTQKNNSSKKIFFYDQEPVLSDLSQPYLNLLDSVPNNDTKCFVVSERSQTVDFLCNQHSLSPLYYFFHGFASLDWYRGFYSLNYNKKINRQYRYDFISFNRILTNDRSYRLYFVSRLAEKNLLKNNLISFGVVDTGQDWIPELSDKNTKLSQNAVDLIKNYAPKNKLVIDNEYIHGSASADIPRNIDTYIHPGFSGPPDVDALWHVVTETVFYYDKLHLTEKIFKPIASKQPFMLLAAPGNLEYLRSYGFKTFDGIIDESYDTITDNDQRVDAVVEQLQWYCNLSPEEKQSVIERLAPIVDYNFHHFYGEFKHIITRELLDNTKTLFKEIGYDDSNIAYDNIYKVLTN